MKKGEGDIQRKGKRNKVRKRKKDGKRKGKCEECKFDKEGREQIYIQYKGIKKEKGRGEERQYASCWKPPIFIL